MFDLRDQLGKELFWDIHKAGFFRFPKLAVSRAIGNQKTKKWMPGIIATPEVKKIKLTALHRLLILACDGIWDKITNDEAAQITQEALKIDQPLSDEPLINHNASEVAKEEGNNDRALRAARALRDAAYNKGSRDNLTALVIEFVWHKHS